MRDESLTPDDSSQDDTQNTQAIMNIDRIPSGNNPPEDINVLIEVPVGGEPIKYELDKYSGALFVDRFLYTPMRYPGNYGFIPHTLSDDGDPVDVLVANHRALMPGSVINCRPVGVLMMEDDGGEDEKIIAVPSSDVSMRYESIKEYTDLPEISRQQIQHFFEHYKDLEPGKWVRCYASKTKAGCLNQVLIQPWGLGWVFKVSCQRRSLRSWPDLTTRDLIQSPIQVHQLF